MISSLTLLPLRTHISQETARASKTPNLILTLPNEVLTEIYNSLDLASRAFFSLTCSTFRAVAVFFAIQFSPRLLYHDQFERLDFLYALRPAMDYRDELCTKCEKWRPKTDKMGKEWWKVQWVKPSMVGTWGSRHGCGVLAKERYMWFCGRHVLKMRTTVWRDVVDVKMGGRGEI